MADVDQRDIPPVLGVSSTRSEWPSRGSLVTRIEKKMEVIATVDRHSAT